MMFPSSKDNTYLIDIENAVETARLTHQSQTIAKAQEGLFPAGWSLSGVRAVLDLACGPGTWALDVAQQFPHVQVTGIDLNETMIRYAQAHARVRRRRNIVFRAMNLQHPLDLPDSSFDVIHARFLASILPFTSWPTLLAECWRLLRPGGRVLLTEAEPPMSNSPALEQLSQIGLRAMHQAGLLPPSSGRHTGLLVALSRLVKDAGFRDIQQAAYALDFSAGTEVHVAMLQNFAVLTQLFKPFALQVGAASEDELDHLLQQMQQEQYTDAFRGLWFLLSVWGHKAS